MTSRRSRLKAVTNLPVRRKVNCFQGNETTSVENLKSEKVLSSESKPDKVITSAEIHSQPNLIVEYNVNDIPNDRNRNGSAIHLENMVCKKSYQNFSSEYECSKNNEDDSINMECINELNANCNVINYKSESNKSVFKSAKRFKPNLMPSFKEKSQAKESEKIREIENGNLEEQIYPSSNVNNKNNVNNIEESYKCYTLLSPQNVTLSPLAEYTITPLTPCVNSFNETTVSDLNLAQDFEEVQIFTEVETAELYENINNVNDNDNNNCVPVIETESEPVLTTLTDCNNELNGNSSNFKKLSSNFLEPRSTSGNLLLKPNEKSRNENLKTVFSGQEEHYTNHVTQIRDTNTVENGVSSGVSCEFAFYKKGISAVKRKRSKCNDLTKKIADAKREFQKKYEKIKPDRSTLKMIDLIFYNPATNPMESKAKFEKKDTPLSSSDETHDLLVEESVDEPEVLDSISSCFSDISETDNASKMPVPQVKIGRDGEIILDEKSLIIETTDAKKQREHLQNSVPILEDRGCKISYYRGKSKKTRDWADCETKRFYKALNTIGPDFSLMQQYFPTRSRMELKNKFKREERLNRNLIDKALNNPSEFDMTQLEKDLAVEKEAEEEKTEMRLFRLPKQTPRKPRVKSSLLSREMIESNGESENSQSKSFSASSKRLSQSEKSKKEKEFDFVFQKLLVKESAQNSQNVLPQISSFEKTFLHSDHGVT